MNLAKRITDKGCLEYADPDMRGMAVPIRIPPGFVMYKICANGCCMNPKHLYFVDADQAHIIEIRLREATLDVLRQYFQVNPETLEPFTQLKPPDTDGQTARIRIPK
jgi:hypothetical protein